MWKKGSGVTHSTISLLCCNCILLVVYTIIVTEFAKWAQYSAKHLEYAAKHAILAYGSDLDSYVILLSWLKV